MIDRISALIEKATPGPWTVDKHGEIYHGINEEPLFDGTEDDIAFIAHARQLLPLMLEEITARRESMGYSPSTVGVNRTYYAQLGLDAYCAEHLPIDQPIDDAAKPIDEKEGT